jgi:hypothetical protein
MKLRYVALGIGFLAALGLAACSQERKATADTGTAEATVSTDAPPAAVPDSQLQSQAQQAATAASTPVDGSGPVESTSPTPPAPPAPK